MTNMLTPGTVLLARSAIVLGGALLASAAGCGPTVPAGFVAVTGTVISGGAPLTTGTVLFSDDAANAGSARIGLDGRFQTFLRPGNVKVAVRATEGVDRLDDKGNFTPAKSLIAESLGDTRTSGLTIDVAGGMKPVTIVLDRQ